MEQEVVPRGDIVIQIDWSCFCKRNICSVIYGKEPMNSGDSRCIFYMDFVLLEIKLYAISIPHIALH